MSYAAERRSHSAAHDHAPDAPWRDRAPGRRTLFAGPAVEVPRADVKWTVPLFEKGRYSGELAFTLTRDDGKPPDLVEVEGIKGDVDVRAKALATQIAGGDLDLRAVHPGLAVNLEGGIGEATFDDKGPQVSLVKVGIKIGGDVSELVGPGWKLEVAGTLEIEVAHADAEEVTRYLARRQAVLDATDELEDSLDGRDPNRLSDARKKLDKATKDLDKAEKKLEGKFAKGTARVLRNELAERLARLALKLVPFIGLLADLYDLIRALYYIAKYGTGWMGDGGPGGKHAGDGEGPGGPLSTGVTYNGEGDGPSIRASEGTGEVVGGEGTADGATAAEGIDPRTMDVIAAARGRDIYVPARGEAERLDGAVRAANPSEEEMKRVIDRIKRGDRDDAKTDLAGTFRRELEASRASLRREAERDQAATKRAKKREPSARADNGAKVDLLHFNGAIVAMTAADAAAELEVDEQDVPRVKRSFLEYAQRTDMIDGPDGEPYLIDATAVGGPTRTIDGWVVTFRFELRGRSEVVREEYTFHISKDGDVARARTFDWMVLAPLMAVEEGRLLLAPQHAGKIVNVGGLELALVTATGNGETIAGEQVVLVRATVRTVPTGLAVLVDPVFGQEYPLAVGEVIRINVRLPVPAR